MITSAIGIGLFIGFVFGELVGTAPGGMVVPGYIALFFDKPVVLFTIIGVSIITYFFMKILSFYFIIFGRRKFVLYILAGFLFNQISYYLLKNYGALDSELYSFGFIVPGLIANSMESQGITSTLCYLTISAIVVKLILIIISGGYV